jgi:hypothetical protein
MKKNKQKKIDSWNLEKKNREVSLQKHHFWGFLGQREVVDNVL